jgi:hypothetical protein
MRSELQALGCTRHEIRKIMRARLGRRSSYQRDALREIGGDWRGLCRLLGGSLTTSRGIEPAFWLLALAILILSNPLRQAMWKSVLHEPPGFVPMRSLVIIPSDFARILWAILLAAALVWLIASHKGWRLSLYASVLAILQAVFGICLWVTLFEAILSVPWQSDMLQGLTLLAFVFLYFGGALLLAERWRRHISGRCPICLRALRMPVEQGRRGDMLLCPLERESVCMAGHGVAIENYWMHKFRCSVDFWQDLAGTGSK